MQYMAEAAKGPRAGDDKQFRNDGGKFVEIYQRHQLALCKWMKMEG